MTTPVCESEFVVTNEFILLCEVVNSYEIVKSTTLSYRMLSYKSEQCCFNISSIGFEFVASIAEYLATLANREGLIKEMVGLPEE